MPSGKRKPDAVRSPARARAEEQHAGEWRPVFLRALANTGNVRASCHAAGVSRYTAYFARKRSKAFAKQWEEAQREAIELLEAEARRRAMSTSDVLLIFLLKALQPEMYRETTRHEVTGREGGPLQVQRVEAWTDVLQMAVESQKRVAEARN